MNRDKKGRFAGKKLTIVFCLSMIALILAMGYFSQPRTITKEIQKVVVLNTTQQIIDHEKNEILDVLQNCESKGDANAIAWEDFGTGKNRASFGAYMLKVGTIQGFVKGLSDFQALALASDVNESRKLSEKIIFENDGGIYNWKNCMIKHNLLARVNFVKELQVKNNTINQD